MHFVGSLLEDNLRDILRRDNADDQVNSDHLDDRLDNARDQTTNENPGKDNLPQEPESPQLDATEIETSKKTGDEDDSTDIARRGSTGKENGVSIQHRNFPSFKYIPFDPTSIALTDGPPASETPRNYMDDLTEKPPMEDTPLLSLYLQSLNQNQ